MLSKVVSSFVLRNPAGKRMLTPVMAAKTNAFYAIPQRFFIDKIGLSDSTELATPAELKAGEVSLWKEQSRKEETGLALKDTDQIEKYVISICRNYFRTTKKAKLALDSNLRDHGLDSLDLIELVIQVEDELGYVIDAENLQKFQKPKHFVNFIV